MINFSNTFPVINIDPKYYLRELNWNGYDPIISFKCHNDPLISQFVPDECIPQTEQDAMMDLMHLSNLFTNGNGIYWAVARQDNDQFIGKIGFHEWNRFHNRVEISYQLDSKYWNMGIMTRALQKVVEYAFKKMRVQRIEAHTVPENYASMKILSKTGFTLEGILSSYKFYKGKNTDVAMFGYAQKSYIPQQSVEYINRDSLMRYAQRSVQEIP